MHTTTATAASPSAATAPMPDLATFDVDRAISLREVANGGTLSIRGKRPSLQMTQRYANPKRGCLPAGSQGPRIVLPTVLVGKERLTLPEWVSWFAAKRREIMIGRAQQGANDAV